MRLLTTILVLAAGAPLAGAQLPPRFQGKQYPTASLPRALDVGDLNGDGRTDVVTANEGNGNLSVLLQTLAGDLAPSVQFLAGSLPTDVSLGDLNGDGFLDAAVTLSGTGDLARLFGNGAGAFGAPSTLPLGADPRAGRLADLDLDGNLDVASILAGSSQVVTRLGDGTGGFGAPAFATVVSVPAVMALGDLNGDGVPDLAAGSSFATSWTLNLGNGAGGFLPSTSFASPGEAHVGLALSDVNGDGAVDVLRGVLVGGDEDEELRVRYGNGAGGLQPATIVVPVWGSPTGIVSADFANDGGEEVLTASGTLVAQLSGGIAVKTQYPTGPTNTDAALADLDGDGDLDAAISSFAGFAGEASTVTVLRGDGAGGFGPNVAATTPGRAHHALGDVNGDGALDVVAANTAFLTQQLTTLLGDGAGGFAGAPVSSATGSTPRAPSLADLDGDGRLDVVFAGFFPTQVATRLGTGTGAFTAGSIAAIPTQPLSLAIGDLDLDGLLDVAAGCTSNAVQVLLGTGGGAFGPPVALAAGPTGGPNATALGVAIADVGSTGAPDLLVTHYPSQTLRFFPGNGTFGAPSDHASGLVVYPSLVAAGVLPVDLTGDGLREVVLSNGVVFAGTPAGPGTRSVLPTLVGTSLDADVAAGDLNGDGRTDLAFTRDESLSIVLGNGAGGAQGGLQVASLTGNSVSVADLDGDGRNDVVVSGGSLKNPTQGEVRVHRNESLAWPGVASFGSGTAGCFGALGMNATSAPAIGTGSFAILTTNAPPSSLGLCIVADAADVAGSDPFGLGVLLHVDLLSATEVLGLDALSDASGDGVTPAPIPANPILSGKTFTAQTLWVDARCPLPPFQLATSRGLNLAIP